jgi:ribosomal protein S18 acetylase RimI-like enzyme
MTGGLTLRRYQPSDAAGVLFIREESLQATGWEFDGDDPPERDITDEFLGISTAVLEAGGEFLVGTDEGRIIAIGGFKPRSETTAELVWMGVHPEYQRQGHGDTVLEELERRAIERGFTRIELETFERLPAARQLYRKHGYERVRREEDPRTTDDRIGYQKDL